MMGSDGEFRQPNADDRRPVFFFDVDNCLYSRSKRVHEMMQNLIDKYLMTHLSLTAEDAFRLHQTYYQQYGLALEGLVRHHRIDPIEYNAEVDDALPLEQVISPDPHLRALLLDLDRSRVRPWLFTNAYRSHGERVVRLLGVDDLFEGMTYCDYAAPSIVCKPHKAMFDRAQAEAGAPAPDRCYFVDDSYMNCRKAMELGWTAVHILEPDDPAPTSQAAQFQIRSLQELRHIFPHFFKKSKFGTA
ncbi:MAG: hypothetical protein M1825_005608 [Sarcosagium campestre]|nr:MAG: hypothetical protein M1825_005608 [Sarcosagium campestre]